MEWTPITRPMLLHNAKQMKPSAASLDQCKPKKLPILALWSPTLFNSLAPIFNKIENAEIGRISSIRPTHTQNGGEQTHFGPVYRLWSKTWFSEAGHEALRRFAVCRWHSPVDPSGQGQRWTSSHPSKKTTPQGPIFFNQSHPPWSPWYPGSGHHPGPSWGPFHLGRRLSHDTFKTAFRGFLHVMEKYLV